MASNVVYVKPKITLQNKPDQESFNRCLIFLSAEFDRSTIKIMNQMKNKMKYL